MNTFSKISNVNEQRQNNTIIVPGKITIKYTILCRMTYCISVITLYVDNYTTHTT